MAKKMKRALAASVALATLVYFYFLFPFWGIPFNAQRHGFPPLTPAWALECWLWEDDVNTADYAEELLQGYARHDIPVRTLLIDSPWSLRYNDFETDPKRYPDAAGWFGSLKDRGYRIVLWMTSMVDSRNKDTAIPQDSSWFRQAADKGYLAGGDDQIKWWKGEGGFIDYTNPEAMAWWRGMQQKVLQMGIDGWKLDGTATLFRKQWGPVPFFYRNSSEGLITTRGYMDLYYRSEYTHGLAANPEFVTLARAIDRGYHPEGFAPIDAAPVTWVGDQRHYWKSRTESGAGSDDGKDIALKGIQGFESAITSILKSARLGYNIIGSDVAGFSGKTIPPRLYIRWTQFSTFCGLFLNGGHGERALWKRSPQELEIIRKFSWLHTELVPYMYHYVVSGHQGGKVLQRPVPGKYHYMFGDDFLIAPIYEDTTQLEVRLPAGKWRYWFDDDTVLTGPQTLQRNFPLEEYPVFIREGAIVPMQIKRAYTGIGDSTSTGYLTWKIYPADSSAFTVYDTRTLEPTTLRVVRHAGRTSLRMSGKPLPSLFNLHFNQPPSRILRQGQLLQEGPDYEYDVRRKKLLIRCGDPSEEMTFDIY